MKVIAGYCGRLQLCYLPHVLSFMIILSMFPGTSDDASIVVRPTDVNFESAEQLTDGIKGETRIVLPIKTNVLEVAVSDE